MSESVIGSARRIDSKPSNSPPTPDTDELLGLLGDEYTRQIVETIGDTALPAVEIAEQLDLSRATVYRRVNRLESAGLLETTLAYDTDGHHRKQFRATLDQVTISLDEGGIAVENVSRSAE